MTPRNADSQHMRRKRLKKSIAYHKPFATNLQPRRHSLISSFAILTPQYAARTTATSFACHNSSGSRLYSHSQLDPQHMRRDGLQHHSVTTPLRHSLISLFATPIPNFCHRNDLEHHHLPQPLQDSLTPHLKPCPLLIYFIRRINYNDSPSPS